MLRFGVAGWDYPDWEGMVYPDPHPRGFDRLVYLSGFLDAIEINVTFYRQPDAPACAGWARRVASHGDFRFTAKLFRGLTHPETPDAPALEDDAGRYLEGIAPLAESGRLGAVLAQFPHRFHDEPGARARLERLRRSLEQLPLVAEFRHRSWDHEEALKFLHGLGVGFCNIDQPQVGGTLRPTGHVTAPVAYVRLHGRNAENWFREGGPPHARYDYLYSEEELRPWAERAVRLSERAEEVFIIANNHYRGKGPANALMLKALATRTRVAAPATLVAGYRALREHARPEPEGPPLQGRLFE
jgi:uncharacterized protein YecE (DUF72 family)